ncbi:MAG: hypothetical protein K0R65_663 [Crocinitomicaceae bacterium]|jgi:hypothetical protein|nr:hypothetical protein [Crocinitomicaceae bacterium]
MILHLHFFLLNENFSPEYAEANHQGKETENNQKYEWEDELEIAHVAKIEIFRKDNIQLEGYLPNEEFFSVQLTSMFVIDLTTENGEHARLGVSESILDHFEQSENAGETTLNVYIKDYEPHGNPVPGIYVASKEFPQDLVF